MNVVSKKYIYKLSWLKITHKESLAIVPLINESDYTVATVQCQTKPICLMYKMSSSEARV